MTTAVAATPTPPTAPKNGKVRPEVLQDILYEILANGIDPRDSKVSAAQIEQFLFEHARTPKTPEAFIEFFEKHQISTNLDDHLKAVELKALPATPPTANGSVPSLSDEAGASNDNGSCGDITSPKIDMAALSKAVHAAPPQLPSAARRRNGNTARTLWAIAAGMVILLGVGAGMGFAIANLEAEVAAAKSAQRQSQQAVVALQQRISGLQSEVERTEQLVEQQKPQLDLITETIAPQQASQPSQAAK